jgi:hypothetical protein
MASRSNLPRLAPKGTEQQASTEARRSGSRSPARKFTLNYASNGIVIRQESIDEASAPNKVTELGMKIDSLWTQVRQVEPATQGIAQDLHASIEQLGSLQLEIVRWVESGAKSCSVTVVEPSARSSAPSPESKSK